MAFSTQSHEFTGPANTFGYGNNPLYGIPDIMTTDWWTFGEHYKETAAGNDMKMATGFPEHLLEAVEKGALTREKMEKATVNILRLILRID